MLRVGSVKTIFVFSLIYASLMAIFVHVIIMPIMLPSLALTMDVEPILLFDMNSFHIKASYMATLMGEGDFSSIRLNSDSVALYAAFIYYITGTHEPYVLIPFNALIHSLTAVLIYYLIKLVLHDKRSAFFGSILFIILPTSIFWYSQLHKDGIFILGVILFILGFIGTLKYAFNKNKIQTLVLLMSPIFANFLTVIVRPYYAPVSEMCAILLVIIFTIYIFYKVERHVKKLLLILGMLFTVTSIIITNNFIGNGHTLIDLEGFNNFKTEQLQSPAEVKTEQLQSPAEVKTEQLQSPAEVKTYPLLNQFKALSDKLILRRVKYIRFTRTSDANTSNIDQDIEFNSFYDLIFYVPRALQIGLAAPFPISWFKPGSSTVTSLFKLLNAFEMIIYYFSFIGIIFIFIKKQELFIFTTIMGYAFINLILYVIAIPNIGTLHRIRYGFVMLVVCLGFAQLVKLFLKYK